MNHWTSRHICTLLVVALVFGGVTVSHAQTTAPCYSYDERCKSIITKVAIVGGIAVAALITWKVISGSRARSRADAAPGRLNLAYDPTVATALEHVVMSPVSSNCPGHWTAGDVRVVSGKLPAGLTLQPDHTIAGFPDVSGTWKAGMGFSGLACTGRDGKRRAYADQTVTLTIRIN